MEMDALELDHNGECIEDTSAGQLLSMGSPDTVDIFGDPQVLPRIGVQYQVEIPPIISESDRLQLIKDPTDKENIVNVTHSFLMGLPIPVMWIHDEVDNIKCEQLEVLGVLDDPVDVTESAEHENSRESQLSSNTKDSRLKVEPLDVAMDYGKDLGGSESHENTVVSNQMDVDSLLLQPKNSNLDQNGKGNHYSPLPGSLGESWSNIEQDSFLLGLYIFGKNLVQVKRFVDSKGMGDILSFYYGKFYRSDGHRRWSECRKMRSRRCIHGQRIFTGWRQQELLSRLLPLLSEERQSSLIEVSKTFGDGKISLEVYVSTLKATVDMNVLIEAVGIGKGKQDLTGIVMEPLKSNQLIATRPEIPIGKACSSLTSGDIIKFLTGDFRLSKARSNDLFWEAVWPRLLARGWHSEQPKNQGYTGAKHSLVFLIPGIKKFSRRKLVKGNHYFDSVSDVLNKVASDPRLLELEIEAAKVNGVKEEYGWDTEAKLDQDGMSDHQRHCYLQARLLDCTSELIKFTIVDTSLVHGEEPLKVRELRSLPVDTTNTCTPTSLSRETDGDSSEDKPEFDALLPNSEGDTSRPTKGMSDCGLRSGLSNCVSSVSKKGMSINGPGPANILIDNYKNQCTSYSNDKHQRKTINCQFSKREKPSQSNYLAPVTKRRRLTSCSHAEANCSMNLFSMGARLKLEEPHCQPDSPDTSDNMVSQMDPSQEKASTSSSYKSSPDESNEGIFNGNCFGTELSQEKPQPRTLIDLNLPVPPDFETGEPFITEEVDSQDDPSVKESSFPSVVSQQMENSETLRICNGVGIAEQPIVNIRRQSTRNRPLTTRALEALACGFFNTKRRKRGTEVLPQENSIMRPTRRARSRSGVAPTFVNVSAENVDSKMGDGVDGEGSCNTNLVRKSQIQPEREGTLELPRIPESAHHPDV